MSNEWTAERIAHLREKGEWKAPLIEIARLQAENAALVRELENANYWLSGLVFAQLDKKLIGNDAEGAPIQVSAGKLHARIHAVLGAKGELE